MRHLHSLSREYWPSKEIGNDVFGHFLVLKFSQSPHLKRTVRGRKWLHSHIEFDREFASFWKLVQQMYPEKEEYFASLLDDARSFKPEWLTDQYNKFLFTKEFEGLSKEEKKNLKDEFESLRPSAYQFALKAEGQRLNCAPSDVRPENLVLPLEPGYDPGSTPAALPDEILAKTLPYLDTIDVFSMTLVCKRWKNLVYHNCAELKRAEHAVTTHLITFTDWMDPPKTPSCQTFIREYCYFSWCLVKWCCGMSSNLETLVLDHLVCYPNVTILLKSCPNLKNLQLGLNSTARDFRYNGLLPDKVHLPKLEVFLHSETIQDVQSQVVKVDVLCSVERLRVLRASMVDKDILRIQAVRPVTNVFRHLIALDLTLFTDEILHMLATIPNLELKYLRLGDFPDEFRLNLQVYEIMTARYRDAFHQLLRRLEKLEVLETLFVPGVTNETIQLLSDLKLNLKYVNLAQSTVRRERYELDTLIEKATDPLDPSLLIEFCDGLLLRNPELDLTDFHFFIAEKEAREQLLALGIGFTFIQERIYTSEKHTLSGLCYPAMRNRLSINF